MTQPILTPFERLGGHDALRALADRFYTLMDSDPAYAEVRAAHGPDLGPIKASLAGFLAGWSGGPRDWFIENKGRCMMSIHAPLTITPTAAGQWADAMHQAIAESEWPDAEMAQTMARLLGDMARSMGR